MGKGKKKTAAWMVLLQGAGGTLAVYLGGILLLALLVVRGAVPESAAFSVVAALCLIAAFAGGMLVARRTPWGTLPSALLNTGIFAGVLVLAGAASQQGISGDCGVLLLCAAAGGVLAGLVSGRRKQRRKRK